MKQASEFPFRGSTKKFTFFTTPDGEFVRPKSKAVDKNRIDTDPQFAKVKKNYTVFTNVMNASGVIRRAFRVLVENAKSRRTSRRLSSLLFRIIKTDTTNPHGQRQFAKANLQLLEQFQFNDDVKLGSRLFAQYTTTVDRATGRVDVQIPSFIPVTAMKPPAGATHYRLVMAAAELDFEKQIHIAKDANSDHVLINRDESPAFLLRATLTPNTTNVIVVVLGAEFYEEVEGQFVLLTPAPLAIINVSKP